MLLTEDWNRTIERLGGAEALAAAAHETKAFAWGRKVSSPVVLLRLVLAYYLGEWGLRSTTAWAAAIGLADLSNVALLYRLRRCGDAAMRRCGDAAMRRCGDAAMRRCGDAAMGWLGGSAKCWPPALPI